MSLQRRGLFRGGVSLGALTMLTGCDISDDDSVQRVLRAFSSWNNRVQAALFSETRLAPAQLIYPLFICPGEGVRRAIGSMPGVFNLSVDEAVKEAEEQEGE